MYDSRSRYLVFAVTLASLDGIACRAASVLMMDTPNKWRSIRLRASFSRSFMHASYDMMWQSRRKPQTKQEIQNWSDLKWLSSQHEMMLWCDGLYCSGGRNMKQSDTPCIRMWNEWSPIHESKLSWPEIVWHLLGKHKRQEAGLTFDFEGVLGIGSIWWDLCVCFLSRMSTSCFLIKGE